LTGFPGRKTEPEIYPRPDGEVYISGEPEATALPDDPAEVSVDPVLCNNIHKASSSVSSILAEVPNLTPSNLHCTLE